MPAESYPLYSNFFKEFIIVDETGLLLFIPIIPHIIIFFFFYNFLTSVCKLLVSAKDFFLTFFVITDPAPTTLPSSIVKGATKDELDPINTLSLIFVFFF